jgi:hypothetical protein
MSTRPQVPQGFVLDEPQAQTPKPPAGFELDSGTPEHEASPQSEADLPPQQRSDATPDLGPLATSHKPVSPDETRPRLSAADASAALNQAFNNPEQLGIRRPPDAILSGPESKMQDDGILGMAARAGTGSVGGTIVPPAPINETQPGIRAEATARAGRFVSGAEGYPKIGGAFKKYANANSYEDPNKARSESGTELLKGVGEAATPLMILGGATAPLKVAAGLGAGYVASKAAGAGADAAGFKPENKELAETAAWFLPSALGLASGLKTSPLPEEVGQGTMGEMFGGKVKFAAGKRGSTVGGSVQVGDNQPITAKVNIPGQEIAPAEPPPPPPSGSVAAATSSMTTKAQTEQAAARIARGLPPVPPPPPAPPPPMVNDQTAGAVGEAIKALPPEQQPAAILEATHKAAESIAHHGGAVVDGEVHTATTPQEALRVAKKVMDGQIAKHDEAAEPSNEVAKPDTRTSLLSNVDDKVLLDSMSGSNRKAIEDSKNRHQIFQRLFLVNPAT